MFEEFWSTLPIDARGSEYLLATAGVPFFIDDTPRLGGGAIKAASGSLLPAADGAGVAGTASAFLGMIGGGARGLATSAGSSPGKIQRFSFSS
jgi:hypothetical protein